MAHIHLDVWLYGRLAKYGGDADQGGYANVKMIMPAGTRLRDVLDYLGLPTEDRGITFINGQLSAMPGLQPDLDHLLGDNDRIGIFDPISMWPFQYRDGAAMTDEMRRALEETPDDGLHHTYRLSPD